MVLTARSGPMAALVGQGALLAVLGLTAGLGPWGWVVGLMSSAVLNVVVAGGMARAGRDRLGPADLVTLSRSQLACAVAALCADAFAGDADVVPLVSLSALALVLDAVDGQVARRTRTQSGFGARFDGEVDTFLILVLSVYVAGAFGTWVLAIGAARYAFACGGLVRPWLRGRLPPRYWRKVVAAVQGIVLTVAVAGVAPFAVTRAALVVALALLAESFGRDVVWLWQRSRREAARARAV